MTYLIVWNHQYIKFYSRTEDVSIECKIHLGAKSCFSPKIIRGVSVNKFKRHSQGCFFLLKWIQNLGRMIYKRNKKMITEGKKKSVVLLQATLLSCYYMAVNISQCNILNISYFQWKLYWWLLSTSQPQMGSPLAVSLEDGPASLKQKKSSFWLFQCFHCNSRSIFPIWDLCIPVHSPILVSCTFSFHLLFAKKKILGGIN